MKNQNDDNKVVEAEVVDHPSENNRSYDERSYNTQDYRRGYQGENMHFSMYTFRTTPGSPFEISSGAITLVLFFVCLVQWGFLASLGFVFFYAIGAVLTTYLNIRLLFNGKMPQVWPLRILNWGICLALVSWLAK